MNKQTIKAGIISFLVLAVIIGSFYFVISHCGTIEGILNLILSWFCVSIAGSSIQIVIDAITKSLKKGGNDGK